MIVKIIFFYNDSFHADVIPSFGQTKTEITNKTYGSMFV